MEPLMRDWAKTGYQFTFSCWSKLDPQHGKCDNPECDCGCHRGDGGAPVREPRRPKPTPDQLEAEPERVAR